MIDINTMRKIDFWIGVPLCFIFTIFYKVLRVLGFRRPIGTPQNILFIELGEMGSSIISYPTLLKAKELYPHANIYFLIFHEIQSSVHLLDAMPKDHVLTIRSKSFFSLAYDTFKFIFVARKHKIDTVIDLEFFSRYSALLTCLSGARLSSGFDRFNNEGMYRGNFYTHKVIFNPYIHTAQAYLSLLYALGMPRGQVPYLKKTLDEMNFKLPRFKINSNDKKHIFNKLQSFNKHVTENSKIVILNPNSSYLITLRRWPLHSYALLAKRLLDDKDVFVVITGVASEKDNALYIKSFAKNDRCIDMAGETTLKELVDLYQVSDVLVTNDSGPAQFAALTPIKIFVFFGPETPVRFKPLSDNVEVLYSNFACSPCVSPFNQLDSPCRDNKCLQVIEVDDVYQRVKSSLS